MLDLKFVKLCHLSFSPSRFSHFRLLLHEAGGPVCKHTAPDRVENIAVANSSEKSDYCLRSELFVRLAAQEFSVYVVEAIGGRRSEGYTFERVG